MSEQAAATASGSEEPLTEAQLRKKAEREAKKQAKMEKFAKKKEKQGQAAAAAAADPEVLLFNDVSHRLRTLTGVSVLPCDCYRKSPKRRSRRRRLWWSTPPIPSLGKRKV